MLTDVEIAQSCKMLPIKEVAASVGIEEDYLDYYNNRRIKLKLNGLTPAMHRSQAILAA